MSSTYTSFFPINLRPDGDKFALYFEGEVPPYRNGNPLVTPDRKLVVDGAMSSLFEREVWGITRVNLFRLSVRLKGSARVLLYHVNQNGIVRTSFNAHSGDGQSLLKLAASYVSAERRERPCADEHDVVIEFSINSAENAFGRWSFAIVPTHGNVEVIFADWQIAATPRRDVWPAFVICTFNRVEQLQNNLAILGPILATSTDRHEIIVVDNARTFELAPDQVVPNLTIIPQKNVGGAGGFGRGIVAALESDAATHIILLDDDANIDGTSIVRMLNAFRFMKDELDFVGGVQMDVYDPVKLADASAYWRADRFENVEARMLPSYLDQPEAKNQLSRNTYTNFNGWWLFGGSKVAFRNNGMPLPIFVHLDDVDYGVRADIAGQRTWTLPGVAVWHEPYYAKVEGWFAFYNIRNELIRLCGQMPRLIASMKAAGFASRSDAAKMLAKRIKRVEKQLRQRYAGFIATNQYGSAYLLCMAIEQFLAGPDALRTEDFNATHQDVMKGYKAFNGNERVLARPPAGRTLQPTPIGNRWRLMRLGWLYRYIQRQTYNGHRLPALPRSPFRGLPLFPDRMSIRASGLHLQSDFAYNDPGNVSLHYFGLDIALFHQVDVHFRRVIRKYRQVSQQVSTQWAGAYDDLISMDYWAQLILDFEA